MVSCMKCLYCGMIVVLFPNKMNKKKDYEPRHVGAIYYQDLRNGVIDPDKSDKPASTFLPRFRRSPHLSGGSKMTFFSFFLQLVSSTFLAWQVTLYEPHCARHSF